MTLPTTSVLEGRHNQPRRRPRLGSRDPRKRESRCVGSRRRRRLGNGTLEGPGPAEERPDPRDGYRRWVGTCPRRPRRQSLGVGRQQVRAIGRRKNDEKSVPVEVKGLSNIIAVAAGENFSLALTEGGAVYAGAEITRASWHRQPRRTASDPRCQRNYRSPGDRGARPYCSSATEKRRSTGVGRKRFRRLRTNTGPETCPAGEGSTEEPCSTSPVAVSGLKEKSRQSRVGDLMRWP